MNRRSFFGRTVGAMVAAVLPWKSRAVTVGGINRATFKFWRHTHKPIDPAAYAVISKQLRDLCAACEEAPNHW